jgi:hypothetical protein
LEKKCARNTALASILGLASLLFAAGCSEALIGAVSADVEKALANDPTIEILRGATPIVDASTVDWGNTPQNASVDISFQIKNTGTGTLHLETPAVSPESLTDGFSLVSLSNSSVSSGASATMLLRFHPSAGASYSSSVAIASNALNDPSVDFSITGDMIAPDVDPPTGSVSVNGGAAYATGATVTLTIAASDVGGGSVTQMEVRNDLAWTGNWQAYATTLPWSLAAGDGSKDVYIRFRDGSSNISSAFSDSIILDTVNPTISSYTPTSSAANQLRSVNAVVNFSENMDQSTFTTSTVYLKTKGGVTVSTTMTTAATSVTLNPVSDLAFGMDYTIVVTGGAKDLSGRSISNPMNATYFTVERDVWEGGWTDGNNQPAGPSGYAYDLTDLNPFGSIGYWFDFVNNEIQEQEWSLPVGAHSTLAQLEGVDYYRLMLPADSFTLRVQVFFTDNETNGTTASANTSGPEIITLYANINGFGQTPSVITSTNYLKDYEYDVSAYPGEDVVFLIQEQGSSYGNKRKYNLRVYIEPGI